MSRPTEAAPALIYKEGDDVLIDGEEYAPETDVPGVKKYVALLSQTSTDAPTADVLENSIGAIVWTRANTGDYNATLAGAFTDDKTVVLMGTIQNEDGDTLFSQCYRATDNIVKLYTYKMIVDGPGVVSSSFDGFYDVTIEIRVYP